jgi:hypothetical protein
MRTLICAIFLAILLIGCSGGVTESKLIGKWTGAPKMPEGKKDDPMAKLGEAFMSMLSMDLELMEKGKFTLTVMIIPIKGDWTLNGNVVTLTPTTVMGVSPEEFKEQNKKSNPGATASASDPGKPMRLEVQPDGKTMKALDELAGTKEEGEFLFTKK